MGTPVAVVDRFEFQGDTLTYETHGEGPRVFLFLHGLMLDAALNRTIAALLADRGHRVVLPELLGHGRSDRPTHAYAHRLEFYSDQVVALLDHLDLDEAVIGGVSLGANVALQVAATHPERVRAMVLEMPVLERGAVAAVAAFFPMLLALRYGERALRPGSRLLRALPRTGYHPFDSFMNLASSDPRELAAVLHGLFVGPGCPPARAREQLTIPSLVIGHSGDLLHPMNDAEALATELPICRLVRAWSVLEARTFPRRIGGEIGQFLDEMWAPTLKVANQEDPRVGPH